MREARSGVQPYFLAKASSTWDTLGPNAEPLIPFSVHRVGGIGVFPDNLARWSFPNSDAARTTTLRLLGRPAFFFYFAAGPVNLARPRSGFRGRRSIRTFWRRLLR